MTVCKSIPVGIAILFVIGAVVWDLQRPRILNPIYQGKPLSYWLGTYNVPTPGTPKISEADLAVRHAGTNAIPLLLRYINAHDSTLKLRMMGWVARQRIIKFPLEYARNRRYQAERGFQALGAEGSSAVPELIRLYEMNNSSPDGFIIEAFGCIGPGAKDALPLVLQAATNSNWILRALAVHSLGQMRVQPETSVPALLGALKDSVPPIPQTAVFALGEFGPQAKEAIPQLIVLRASAPSPGTITVIDEALRKIEPAAAANAGIQLTNASPAR